MSCFVKMRVACVGCKTESNTDTDDTSVATSVRRWGLVEEEGGSKIW